MTIDEGPGMRLVVTSAKVALLLSVGSVAYGQSDLATIPATSYQIVDGVTKRIKLPVSISEFQIAKTEVTQKQYADVVGANPSYYKGDDRPVENVNWWDAIRYCNLQSRKEGLQPCYDLATGTCDFSKTGYRLPTEREWDVACAGADATLDPTRANIGVPQTRNSRELVRLVKEKGTMKVGSYPPNKYGLFDMAGNVWEWCYDHFNEEKDVLVPSLKDPTGPTWGVERVIRGGSFLTTPYIYRLEHNGQCSLRADRGSKFTGFRVCRSVKRTDGKDHATYSPNWFEPYNRVPKALEGRGELPSLLVDAEGKAITTAAGWEKKRAQLKEKWTKRLGIPPKPPNPPEVNVAKTFDEEIYTGKLIYLEWDRDLWIKIVLMVPKKPSRTPTPAVVVHWYDVDAAVGKNLGGHLQQDPAKLKAFGLLMVQQGYVAVAVKWWDLIDESYEESMANLKLRFPECSGFGKTVWDTRRVVDYLHTLPEVDHKNIGVIGHCMAGITTIYSAAFDERITAAVACGSNCSVFDSNYYDYWYWGDELLATITKATDQQELFAIMAPRPFLLALGKGNYIDQCHPYVNTAREVYRLYGKPEHLGYVYDRQDGVPSPATVPLMQAWLMRFLGPGR